MSIASAPGASMQRLPALDGVRGLAILAILLYHGLGFSTLTPDNAFDSKIRHVSNFGWVGVDLFFVLSGFLITGILLDSRGRARSLLNFYGRRLLRIVPVYAALLIALLVVVPLVISGMRDDPDLAILRGNQWWYGTFTFNIMVVLQPTEPLGRFGNGHLWSLMVEEQFYLVWPFIVLFLPKRALLPAILLAIVGAPLLRYAAVTGHLPHLHNGFSPLMLMPMRMDSLALGALIAYCMRDAALWLRLRSVLPWAAAVAVGTIAVIVAGQGGFQPFDRGTQLVGLSAIAVLFAAVVTFAASQSESPLTTALGHPFLRFFGKYSYALYVFHFQIMLEVARHWNDALILGSHTISRLAFTVLTTGVSVAVAWLSWHLLEERVLSLKRFFPNRPDPAATAPELGPAPIAPVSG